MIIYNCNKIITKILNLENVFYLLISNSTNNHIHILGRTRARNLNNKIRYFHIFFILYYK